MTSISGRIAVAAHGSYAASKFALEALSEALAHEVKAFNIRVAIVEPGFVRSAIFEKLPEDPPQFSYPHEARMRAVHAAAFPGAASPFVMGEAIREIVENNSWQLRYPVGPVAAPFIKWRAAMTDEEWVARNAVPNDEE